MAEIIMAECPEAFEILPADVLVGFINVNRNYKYRYPIPGNAKKHNLLIQTVFCIFIIAITVIVVVGLFVALNDTCDFTLDSPGEGHRDNPN